MINTSAKIFVLGLASAAFAVSASAADIYRSEAPASLKDAPYVTVSSWTGFYAGVNGGYGWSANNLFSADPVFSGISPEGGFGGGQIGYNWQNGHLVLGVEADIQGSGISDEKSLFGTLPVKSNLDWFGTVRGRLGYAIGNTLVYATGGFAYGGVDNLVTGMTPFRDKETATGYVAGGGVEYKINPAWSVKAEYQYLNLGKNEPVYTSGGVTYTATSIGFKVDDNAYHTIRAGLNYHFAPGYEPLK